MKKENVKLGGKYFANVSGRRVIVQLDSENRHGGWTATNLSTGKQVRIKTAARLTPTSAKGDKSSETPEEPQAPKTQTPAKARKKSATAESPSASVPEKKLSAVAAAARVLVESGQPMNAKQLIEAMAQKGYWTSPGGKTPEATLYAAIAREIKTKGDQSRFTNPERGMFAARV
jgi:hypothetical protein